MPDDAVLPFLQRIQEDLAAVKRQGETNARTLDDMRINLAVVDRSLTREFEIVKQDVRMIRSTIEDMGETRVTEGEVAVLHEDVNRVQARLANLETRMEELEGRRTDPSCLDYSVTTPRAPSLFAFGLKPVCGAFGRS
jgi:predicted  nucleic acid-binding Zn-ribbon protein